MKKLTKFKNDAKRWLINNRKKIILLGGAIGTIVCGGIVFSNKYEKSHTYQEDCEGRYSEETLVEPIILEPEDWTETEWNTICKLFGMASSLRIVISQAVIEAFGVN